MRDSISPWRKILGTFVVAALLTIDVGAAFYTLFGVGIPTVPFFHFWIQGMTGPWQAGSSETGEFRAFGNLQNGEATEMDLDQYLPGRRGDRGMRLGLHGYGRPYHYGDSPEEQQASKLVTRSFYPEPSQEYWEERREIITKVEEAMRQRIYREHLLPQLVSLYSRDHPEAPMESLTLVMEIWPTSREGYEALRKEPYLKTEIVARYP